MPFAVRTTAAIVDREDWGRLLRVRIGSGMKFVVSIYQDEDGMYIAECPSIPGCVSQGQTEAEAEVNVADAIRECLAVRAELGMPLTVTTREVEVSV
jgi:predicted RNase H-like HicB family nuclease